MHINLRNRFNHLRRFIKQRPGLEKRKEIQSGLAAESTVDVSYLVLTLGACAIATLGLLSDSTAVIIGAMILAPLMLPIRSLALAALSGNTTLFRRSAGVIAVALMPPLCVIGLGLSKADWLLSSGATLLYLTNLLGITLSCMVIFLVTGCVTLPSAVEQ